MYNLFGPLTTAGATILVQVFLLTILWAGSITLWGFKGFQPMWRRTSDGTFLGWVALALAIITIALVVLTQQPLTITNPLLGLRSSPSVAPNQAMPLMFGLNFACVALFVALTGGSRVSPFSPIYFILPVFAVFLGEPPERLQWYFIFAFTAFLLTFFMNTDYPTVERIPEFWKTSRQRSRYDYAYLIVSFFSLFTTFLVYVFRPR